MKTKTAIYIALATVATTAFLTLPYSVIPTGNTKVVQQSVCAHSYQSGVGGTARQVCDRYTSVSVTSTEYTYTNLLGFSWIKYNR